jgi:hypothetical protein
MPPAHPILSADQIEAYHRDGFIVPSYRLPEEDIAKLQALTLKLIEDNPTLADHHMVGPHVPGRASKVSNRALAGWVSPPILTSWTSLSRSSVLTSSFGEPVSSTSARSQVPPRHGTATPAIPRSNRLRRHPSGLPSSTVCVPTAACVSCLDPMRQSKREPTSGKRETT